MSGSGFAFTVEFTPEWSRQPGRCGAAVFVAPPEQNDVVIVTDLADNKGPSVTNAIEAIANRLAALLHCERLEGFTLVEHYPANSLRDGTWAVVELDHDGRSFHNPRWRHITRDVVEAMVPGDYQVADLVGQHDPMIERLAERMAGAQ